MVLDKLKQLKQMRDQALAIQRELAKEKIEVEEAGVRVVMTGDQKIETLEVDGESKGRILEVINKAIKKSQKAAAQKMARLSGGLSDLLPRF